MAYDLATVTNSGNQLLASVVSDKSSLVIDKIEVSNTQLSSSTDLKSMTSISNVVQTLSANGYQKKDNSFIISTVLDNSSVTADYKAWVFGIWAHEADGGIPVLMSVITSTSSPDTISKGSGTPIDYNYKFITTFSNTSSLTIQMASDTYATNDTVLHNSGDETATGTKTFQEIKISNNKFPSLVQTDGQYITLDSGNSEIVPADDSKVVHDNHDGTEQLNGVQVQPFNKLSDSVGGRNLLINTAQLNDSTVCLDNQSNTSDTYLGLNIYQVNKQYDGERIFWPYLAQKLKTNTDYVISEYVRNTSPATSAHIGLYENDAITGKGSGIVYNDEFEFSTTLPPTSGWTRIYALINIASFPTNIIGKLRFESSTTLTDGYVQFAGLKLEQGSIATDWTPAPEDKVNVSEMRKPASDVAGIEEVNAKQDKLTITPADDSKVAHLSGANNFDTVPTVNNNPLLLASSLPSDLARTGSDQEFTGKNTFDTAPIDKTTGNPYITKDGVPSDVARTGQAQTFTAAQTFSIAPVINDASTDKGGNQAATMADLKSVEESAWYIIPEDNNNLIRDIGWIKRDPINKYLYILFNFAAIPWVPKKGDTIINLSKYVDSLSDARGYAMLSSNEWLQVGDQWTLRHNYRVMSTIFASGPNLIVGSGFNFSDPNDGGDYLNLSTFDDNVDQTSWANKTIRVNYNNWIGS